MGKAKSSDLGLVMIFMPDAAKSTCTKELQPSPHQRVGIQAWAQTRTEIDARTKCTLCCLWCAWFLVCNVPINPGWGED